MFHRSSRRIRTTREVLCGRNRLNPSYSSIPQINLLPSSRILLSKANHSDRWWWNVRNRSRELDSKIMPYVSDQSKRLNLGSPWLSSQKYESTDKLVKTPRPRPCLDCLSRHMCLIIIICVIVVVIGLAGIGVSAYYLATGSKTSYCLLNHLNTRFRFHERIGSADRRRGCWWCLSHWCYVFSLYSSGLYRLALRLFLRWYWGWGRWEYGHWAFSCK